MSTLAEKIKVLRVMKGLTQEELAKYLHVNRATLANWETGRTTPDYEAVKHLADFFDVSIDYLFGRSDDPRFPDLSQVDDALKETPELLDFWRELKEREDLQLLFKQARDLSPESIRRAVQVIKLIEDREAQAD